MSKLLTGILVVVSTIDMAITPSRSNAIILAFAIALFFIDHMITQQRREIKS